MHPNERTKISRFLSLVLRHQPEKIGLALDHEGWTSVDGLVEAMNRHGHAITFDMLEEFNRHIVGRIEVTQSFC